MMTLSPLDLFRQAIDELDGASEYINVALTYKEVNKDVSRQFYEMAGQEMHHADGLYALACKHWSPDSDLYSVKEIHDYVDMMKENYLNHQITLKTAFLMYENKI
jgi:rubrerythrin